MRSAMDARTLDGTTDGTKGGVIAVLSALRDIKRDDADPAVDNAAAAVTAAGDLSTPFSASAAEEAVLVRQLQLAAADDGAGEVVAHMHAFWLHACVRARKGDVSRALLMARNYCAWRTDVCYIERAVGHNVSAAVRRALCAGLFTVAGNHARDGRPVLTVRFKFFDPRVLSALDVARTFGLLVEYMLREYPLAQTHGLAIVEDADGFSLGNMDLRLVRFLSNAFSKVLPVRITSLNIVNPSWLAKTMFQLMSGFISRKLQARIRVFDKGAVDRFAQFFEPHQTPTFLQLGGTLEWTEAQQHQLANRIIEQSAKWPPVSSHSDAL